LRIILKILGILVLIVIVFIAGVLIYLFTALPKKEPPVQTKVEATPARIARGDYLARHVTVCLHCHSDRNLDFFAEPSIPGTEGQGHAMFSKPQKGLGVVYAPNITPYALSGWSDGEIMRAVTSGITKNGDPLFPIMPYDVYSNLNQEDLYSVVVFVRRLKPITNDLPKTKLDFPLNLIVRLMPAPAKAHEKEERDPGHYLVSIAGCMSCHTQDQNGKALPGMTFAGGKTIGPAQSANITPDEETGIGKWTKQDFIAAFKKWQDPSLQKVTVSEGLNTPMPWIEFSGMREEDLAAIYDYLRTVPPVHNAVKRFSKPSL